MNAHPFFHRGQVLFNEINNFISGIVPLDTFPSLLKQFKPLLLTPLQIEVISFFFFFKFFFNFIFRHLIKHLDKKFQVEL